MFQVGELKITSYSKASLICFNGYFGSMVWLDEGMWEDGDGVLLLTIVTKSWIVLLFSTHEKDISSIECKNSNVSVLCSSFGRKKSVEFAIHFEFIHNYSLAVRLKVG